MKLLGISGTITGTKTLAVVERVIAQARSMDAGVNTGILDLKRHALEFCDGRDPANYSEETRRVIEEVVSADAYIIGTPIFQASLTGSLKNLFDLLPVTAFRGKVIGFAATGGTYQHFLVIENQLKPIAGYFRAYTAPEYVYVHQGHFGPNNEIVDTEVLSRIDKLAAQVLKMSKALCS